MKNRKKFIIVSIVILIILVILLVLNIINSKYTNNVLLNTNKSLVTLQSEYEDDFVISGYTIDNPNVILAPYKSSPLSALILFETDNYVSVSITIVGKDDNSTFNHTFDKAKEHYIPVYGLYADYNNKVIIEYDDNGKKISKEISIKTDKLPDDFILPSYVYADKSNLGNELYFYTPSSIGYTCAYDANGDVRWYLSHTAIWDNTRLKNGHMMVSTERRINSPYYMTGLYEIDMLGKIYVEYSLKGGYHHDYYELPSGNLLVSSDDFNNESGTVEDYVVELDRATGKIVKFYDLKDILNMTDGKSENWISYDWFHNNSVWYDEKTNSITLSGRHQDAVINIDYDSGKLNWIIGDSTNWSSDYQKYFFKPIGDNFEWQWSQHAAMITPEGYVFIFDNGNNKSKDKDSYVDATDSYSRGVMYKIDTDNMTIEQLWEYGKERGSEFYSPYISDVDYIDSNHYIVHSGGIVYVDGKNSNQPAGIGGADKLVSDTVELLNDKIIFEIKLPTNNYRVEKLSLYTDNNFELGKTKRIGTLGSTKIDKKKYGAIGKYLNIDSNYKNHNIEWSMEEDRLVFSGTFKKGSDVKIILYDNLVSNVYNVSVSKKPYTALCVDVFTDTEKENGINVTKYINKDGLKGEYSIYLSIDGKIYNTNKYIKF